MSGASPETSREIRRPSTDPVVALDSRFPAIEMPSDSMWPMRLHDETVRLIAIETLPKLITALSAPVPRATRDQLAAIFAQNPYNRNRAWVLHENENGTYTYSTEAYLGPKDEKGSQRIYRGLNYTFDLNGRLVKFETIEDEGSYDRGRPNYQEFLTYDDDGYLIERSTWQRIMQPLVTDRFEYTVSEDEDKVPSKMTRTVKVQGAGYKYEDSEPMTVDLANHEEWLARDPNGFSKITKEQLEPREFILGDYEVSEHRRGILFPHPEQLELALVMYGSGSYPTPGGETALEHNDKVFAEGSALGGMLFSLMSRNVDMGEFVRTRIMDRTTPKWDAVQKSKHSDASESVHFSFDYDGAGHFHKTSGEISITKQGVELRLRAAYVGDEVEDHLASALSKKRGLRSATIDVPVNQTSRDGYFLVDLQAVCGKLGIPLRSDEVNEYLREYLGEDEFERSPYDRSYGKQPTLWEDVATGVKVILETQRRDYDANADLDDFFGHDETSIWGPLPKDVRHLGGNGKKYLPKVKVIIEPVGNPFDENTAGRTDEIIRSYMSRLEKTA